MMWLVIEGQQIDKEASNCDFKFTKQRNLRLTSQNLSIYLLRNASVDID